MRQRTALLCPILAYLGLSFPTLAHLAPPRTILAHSACSNGNTMKAAGSEIRRGTLN